VRGEGRRGDREIETRQMRAREREIKGEREREIMREALCDSFK